MAALAAVTCRRSASGAGCCGACCRWSGPVGRACPRSHGCGRSLSEAPPRLRSARPLCAGIESNARAHTFILVTTTRMNSDQHLVVVLSHHHSPPAQTQTLSSAHTVWCCGARRCSVVVGAVAPRGRPLCGCLKGIWTEGECRVVVECPPGTCVASASAERPSGMRVT